MLNAHPDFLHTRPILQEFIERASPHRYFVMFLPKYHCELNPIELVRCIYTCVFVSC